MQILKLNAAAAFLDMSPITLRRLVKQKKVRGSKVGGEWRFVDEHLANDISGIYNQGRQDAVEPEEQWQSTKEKKSTGAHTRTQTETEYSALLGLNPKRTRNGLTRK